ncbi:Scp160p NDAI_0G05590 [Naumovozyma dairenensis CBS 421]|uniref:K Homology domain-containing protein n=1 Tax=Naumovozyma dairenensis (strain ATCC 10597 / BCRC 20456 / CBS 421 / NBRC 0211 / NRRL Y-12639) TaxID=1071378 RepID=J7RTH6_NAUDC|nr:hypothetical protein NDAI_0G05590 [Naumovozyma dairenensis CBS 421]CCK73542.1 hypothetical protein NDAI_0G05590 [Naumovozyma dairenensis CBS 421]
MSTTFEEQNEQIPVPVETVPASASEEINQSAADDVNVTIENSEDASVATQGTDATAATSTTEPAIVQPKVVLPSLKDLPSLSSNSAFANSKVSWGPNMKPQPVPVSNFSTPSLSSSSLSPSPVSAAKRMRSRNIQETFTLDLRSQLSITKPELSRIVQNVKQTYNVSVESTLSKNSRTFLISGIAENVQSAKRDLVKKLTRPIDDSMTVPARCRAAIIGAGGKTIREISDQFEVRINLARENNPDSYDEDLNDFTVDVHLHGDFESVNLAKRKIEEIVKEETKTLNIRVPVEDAKIAQFVNLSSLSIPDDVKCVFYQDSAEVAISGPREDVKSTKVQVQDFLNQLSSTLTEEKVKIPTKFQFLIDAKQLKEEFNVIVTFPTDPTDELVSFVGQADKVKEAIEFARSNSKKFVVDSLDISKSHSKNLVHAKNLALYFIKYNVLKPIEDAYPDVKIVLPAVSTLKDTPNVTIQLSSKSDSSNEIKSARKELISFVNSITPLETLTISDLDYELFHKSIHHILLATEDEVPYVQVGDYFHNNDDSIVLFSKASDEDFKPSAEETMERLEKINLNLDPLRTKQKNMSTKTFELPAEIQDDLLAGQDNVTLKLILDEVSHEEGNIQIRLHTPDANHISIRGDEKAVKIVHKALNSIVENPSKKSKLTVEIPNNTVARLVGTKGANLNQIREKFNCQIDVPNHDAKDNDKTVEVTLTGLEYNLTQAKKYIVAESKKWADIITKELIVPQKLHRNLIGANGVYRNRLQDKYNVFINFPRTSDIVTIRGPSRGVKQAYEELSALLEFERENGYKMVINVPAEHVPRVIGKNGSTINDIRADFGVEMDFLQKNTDLKVKETGEVELEITGTRSAIKEAAKKVESIVSEASDFITESLEVDRKYHRTIVGAGGNTLRTIINKAGGEDIRNKSIDIPNANAESNVITIQGPKSFVESVKRQINKIVEDGENSITKELEIPNERQGALVGPGGMVRRQLETEFNIIMNVPNKNETGPVTLTGLPDNIAKAEKKIMTEIIRDNFDREIQVPAALQEFVSERGAFTQKLRLEEFVHVRHGNATRRANRLNRHNLVIPVEKVRPTEEEKKQQFKVTIEEVGEPRIDGEEGEIPWRLTYEPIDFSEILTEDNELKADTPVKIDEAKKAETLDRVVKQIEDRIAKAATSTFVGYVWCADPRKFNKLVGPGGSNIKKIRDEADVVIDVPKRSDKVKDIVYVRGSKEGVEKAQELIIENMKN